MFLDKAVYDILDTQLPIIRTDAGAAWVEDAFGFLQSSMPGMFDEIRRYLRREKVKVQYDYERVEPVFPLVNIGGSAIRTKPQQAVGNSRQGVNLGGGIGKIEYRYEMEITGLRVQCITRNPDQTLYLWMAVQKLLIACQPALHQAFGFDANGLPQGFYGVTFSGEGQTYPVGASGVDAYARDVVVNANFQDRVAERATNTVANSITLNVNMYEEARVPAHPWDEGDFQ